MMTEKTANGNLIGYTPATTAPGAGEDFPGWTTWAPRTAVRPVFRIESAPDGRHRLRISGGGNELCFGRWQRRTQVKGGKTYRVRVRFRAEEVADVNLHVLCAVVWMWSKRAEKTCPQNYVSRMWREPRTAGVRGEGEWVAGEEVFQAPKEAESALVHLYLRFSAGGSVVWDAVELSEVAPAPMPRATVATVRWRPAHPSTPEKNREFWAGLLDRAGAQKVDLVCLPEAMNQASLSAPLDELAEAIPGPTFNMLAEKARQHAMNVCGCFYERQGDFIFNTAVLVNRRGEMIGKYRKVHPYWPEEPDGCSPGDDLPVFESDVGRIGIMICYDSWFPETARLLALKGAEIILFPNAGYELKIIPARAIDNDVYVVVASLASPGVIVDTCGNMLAETTTDGLITASIIPRHRPTPHANAGGTLNASPGGRRGTRNAASLRLYDEIRAEIARWESPCK